MLELKVTAGKRKCDEDEDDDAVDIAPPALAPTRWISLDPNNIFIENEKCVFTLSSLCLFNCQVFKLFEF